MNEYAMGKVAAVFPRSNERGSIEAKQRQAMSGKSMAFRVQTNAAPLKRTPGTEYSRRIEGFPRSNERGSIEAALPRRSLRRWRDFPRSNERGSIEAVAPGTEH